MFVRFAAAKVKQIYRSAKLYRIYFKDRSKNLEFIPSPSSKVFFRTSLSPAQLQPLLAAQFHKQYSRAIRGFSKSHRCKLDIHFRKTPHQITTRQPFDNQQ